MNDFDSDCIVDKINIDVPNLDKNKKVIFCKDGVDITCHYDEKYSIIELQGNKSGFIVLANICLQIANSNCANAHTVLDKHNCFSDPSDSLVIKIKRQNIIKP